MKCQLCQQTRKRNSFCTQQDGYCKFCHEVLTKNNMGRSFLNGKLSMVWYHVPNTKFGICFDLINDRLEVFQDKNLLNLPSIPLTQKFIDDLPTKLSLWLTFS